MGKCLALGLVRDSVTTEACGVEVEACDVSSPQYSARLIGVHFTPVFTECLSSCPAWPDLPLLRTAFADWRRLSGHQCKSAML